MIWSPWPKPLITRGKGAPDLKGSTTLTRVSLLRSREEDETMHMHSGRLLYVQEALAAPPSLWDGEKKD